MSQLLFIPTWDQLDLKSAWQWYGNIQRELPLLSLSASERRYLNDYYQKAGLLVHWRQNFFKRHYAETLAHTAQFLFASHLPSEPFKILDLGCGTGTQTLFFASLGCEVLALDADSRAIGILEKRKRFYEKHLKRSLAIEAHTHQAIPFNYANHQPFHAMYALFSFNMMQPSLMLLEQLLPHLASQARIVIQDGNRESWANRWLPWRRRNVLSPNELQEALIQGGCSVEYHRGGVSLPPMAWTFGMNGLLRKVDNLLNQTWFFPISHQIMAIKS